MMSRWINAQIKENAHAGRYGFNHPIFDQLRKRQMEQDDYISNPYEVEEGLITCGKCNSKRVYSVSVQTRAADEPMSTRAFCVACRHQWTQNC